MVKLYACTLAMALCLAGCGGGSLESSYGMMIIDVDGNSAFGTKQNHGKKYQETSAEMDKTDV